MKTNHFNLNGIKTYAFASKKDLIEYVGDQKKILVAINAEKILTAKVQLSELINDNIGYADGIGTVWALKSHGFKNAIKIPGCELWLDIIKSFYLTKSFYLIGAKQSVINEVVLRLRKEYPSINILNYRDGYITNEHEKLDLIDDLKVKKPDIVFVAAGSPKQEYLMKEMLSNHPALYMGLGGSFDVYTGTLNRAPELFQKLSLEWFYRLLKQPMRVTRQVVYFKFMLYLLTKKI